MKTKFSPNRVAQIVGVPREQVIKWEVEGTITPSRDGRNQRVFTREDVRRALEISGQKVSKRIAVVNQKGGVGKTTTVFNLGAALVMEGRKVLTVDLDAQASLTISHGFAPDQFPRTSHDLLVNDEVTPEETIIKTPLEGLDLIPADIRLASADVLLREMIMRERILLTKFEPLLDRYDFILFDCPPNVSTITINALVASTDAVVPMETQFYSIKAVEDLSKTFHVLATRMRHELEIWMLPMKIDRRIKASTECLARMETSFAGRLLTAIRTDANIMKAPLAKEPAVTAFPASRGARDYRRVARELTRATVRRTI